MSTSSVRVFLISIVIIALVSETMGFCNLLATKFRLLGCAANRRFPCGVIDGKLRLLGCRQFGCEGYRDLATYCTGNCDELVIANGMCRFGTRCCLNVRFAGDLSFENRPGESAVDLILPDLDDTDPGAN